MNQIPLLPYFKVQNFFVVELDEHVNPGDEPPQMHQLKQFISPIGHFKSGTPIEVDPDKKIKLCSEVYNLQHIDDIHYEPKNFFDCLINFSRNNPGNIYMVRYVLAYYNHDHINIIREIKLMKKFEHENVIRIIGTNTNTNTNTNTYTYTYTYTNTYTNRFDTTTCYCRGI